MFFNKRWFVEIFYIAGGSTRQEFLSREKAIEYQNIMTSRYSREVSSTRLYSK